MKSLALVFFITILFGFGGANNKVVVKLNGKAVKSFSKSFYEPPTSFESVPKSDTRRTEIVSLEVVTPPELEKGTDSVLVTLKGAYGKYILHEEKQTVRIGELVTFHGVTDVANQKFDRNGKKVLLERYIISVTTLHKEKGDYLAVLMLE